ncbi:hypothetical protein [Phocaeicola sp.]|uniref:hypothetical protein n=1 Tax=Phocaeicola sp. TaxID=2773926 RepID=UPI00307B1AA1
MYTNKKQLGDIGESIVQTKLMQLGLNVINANTIKYNYEAIDLICTYPETGQTIGIQVKTCRENNFPIGITLGNCIKTNLQKQIHGPWIFVYTAGEGLEMTFRFFILSRQEMIDLANKSNDWYVNQWKPAFRRHSVNLNNACSIKLRWLEGHSEDENEKHQAFINPLTQSTENKWNKIIEEFQKERGINTILQTFTGVTELPADKKYNELCKQFHSMAKRLLFEGYFLVNKTRRICLEEIEFYYNESSSNGLKDPVMYHTEDHKKSKGELPYFIFGSLNCHLSGIDVTFENPEKQYRASFLIRGYKVESFCNGQWITIKKHESRSTYIYEDLMMNLSLDKGITIEWINENLTSDKQHIEAGWRKNVPAYTQAPNNQYIKEEITPEQYNQLPTSSQNQYFAYGGKRFKKCNRLWNFKKVKLDD